MQLELLLVFLAIWLLSLWLGSIALEATGMERTKARFQALSALTGSGFTTRETESVVNHPKRRRIVSWLMFLGNAGVIVFIVAFIIWIRSTLTSPSPFQIILLAVSILVFGLFIWLGTLDRITSRLVGSFRKKGMLSPDMTMGEIVHQTGEYGVVRQEVGAKVPVHGCALKEIGAGGKGHVILAIERGDKVLPLPKAEEIIMPGDHLLCYGQIEHMTHLT
jgi:hypothetical protein